MISPKTKILDLLREYPQLEEVLFDISPAFKQLKNPVLRRTVARVTTLQQAAIVGGLKVEDLINRLRRAAGEQGEGTGAQGHGGTGAQGHGGTGKPDWYIPEMVTRRLDAREMLNRGEHPVGQVLADLQQLDEGEIYELTAPFNPAPLIDKATGLGFRHWVDQVGEEEFRVYFSK
ncbi:MAG: hypothetical protein A2X22_01985 [Bacteroidetes bacterium GWF2_49_14]|nr:MAG: hypothetical protein A2X22_01985 [Bacteroidetes bacterium GWF2_49_14]HBB92638.1 hypothetical protein [Bacteroidales bacterium]